jgi:hypothetical protein
MERSMGYVCDAVVGSETCKSSTIFKDFTLVLDSKNPDDNG